MPSNRLLPQQFGPNLTLDGTRIEQNAKELAALFSDVPADLVSRRWSAQHVVGHFAPSSNAAASSLPFLGYANGLTAQNPSRVKSCKVVGIDNVNVGGQDLLTWELALYLSRPTILSSLTLAAAYDATFANDWTYGAAAPPPFANGDPSQDFTLQACVDDGWDWENRRKLRQELLVWQVPADAFRLTVPAALPGDNLAPSYPTGLAPQAHVVAANPIVLLPQNSRLRFQLTVPVYANPAASSWGARPWQGNIWTLHAEVLEAVR